MSPDDTKRIYKFIYYQYFLIPFQSSNYIQNSQQYLLRNQNINLLYMQGNKKDIQGKKEIGRWAPDEHQRFMAAIATYGKDWKKVQQMVGTRSGSQVRSHAQKFFNKLLKQQTQKKTEGKNIYLTQPKHEHQIQQSENSFFRYVGHEECSNTTPIQIVNLIKGQGNNGKKIDMKNFKKQLEQRIGEQNQQQNDDQPLITNLQRQNSYKSMNNILEAYETVKDQTKNNEQGQSFLMGLTRHYKKFFKKGGKFENLIDFGNPAEVEKFQNSIRKRSFTLPQGVEGDESDLNQRKKRVIAEPLTAKMTERQKQLFSEQMKKQNGKEKQKQKQAQAQAQAQRDEKNDKNEEKEKQTQKSQQPKQKQSNKKQKSKKANGQQGK